MSKSNRQKGPWFHIQGAGLLGVIVGAIISAIFPFGVGLAVTGVALVVFAIFFRKTLWPLLSRKGLYENFFGLRQVDPLLSIVEGVAGGGVLGGLTGLFVPGYLVAVLVFVGVALLVFRYHETLGLVASTLGAKISAGTPRSPNYRQLLRRAGGDENLVERLIAYERRRAPTASREEWIERAIARWDRDRG